MAPGSSSQTWPGRSGSISTAFFRPLSISAVIDGEPFNLKNARNTLQLEEKPTKSAFCVEQLLTRSDLSRPAEAIQFPGRDHELVAVGLEAQQRVIPTAPLASGIVADACSLLMPVESDDYRIQIQDDRRAGPGPSPQLRPQPIVQPDQLTYGRWVEPLQKTAQRGGVREAVQADTGQEGAVVLEDSGFADAAQPRDEHVEQDSKRPQCRSAEPFRPCACPQSRIFRV